MKNAACHLFRSKQASSTLSFSRFFRGVVFGVDTLGSDSNLSLRKSLSNHHHTRNTLVPSFHTLSSLLAKDEVTTKSLSYGSGGNGSGAEHNHVQQPTSSHDPNPKSDDATPQPTANNNSPIQEMSSIILSFNNFEEWTKEEVASILCMKKHEGGASLYVEKVKPLYSAGFDGASLDNIVQDIKRHDVDFAIKAMSQSKDFSQVSESTCKAVVNWVYNTLMPNLQIEPFQYFPRSERELLTKADEILEGNIDSDAKRTNIPQMYKQWYLSFCNLVIKDQAQGKRTHSEKENYSVDLLKLFSNARDIIFSNVNTDSILNKSNFETVMNNMVNDLLKKKDLEKEFFMRNLLTPFNTRCPSQFVRDVFVPTNSTMITKDLFPFLPKLQVDLFNESERKTLDQKIRDGSTICVIGPSGVGKTALLARRLGVNPGIMITCTSLYDRQHLSERGTDQASDKLRETFVLTMTQSVIKLYATAAQQVQCNFIARLLCLHTALTIWEQTDNKTPFETPLQMLSYSQWNGNTKTVANIFNTLLERQWLSLPTETLRDFTIFLIEQLYSRLKLDKQPFIIAVDEANIFSILHTPMLSENGTPRDLLSLIAFEISQLRKKTYMKISDIYCGTMFTTDIVDIIQSSIGKLEDVCHVYSCVGLDSITFEQALQILDKMYDIEAILKSSNISKIDLYHSIQHIFPTRRRVVGLVASYLETTKTLDIEESFRRKWKEFVDQVEKNVLHRFDCKKSTDRLDLNFLLDVVITNEYDAFLGKSISCDRTLASSLIGTGLAKPNFDFYDTNSDMYHFDTSDPILKHVAKEVLEKKYPNSITKISNPISVLNLLLSLPQHDPKKWEMVFSLLLQHHSGKCIRDNLILSPLILDFYRKHYTSKWAQEVLTNTDNIDSNMLGDILYFHCLLNYNKHIEESSTNNTITFKDLIDGVYFYPSLNCHADGICLNFSEQPYGIIVSNKLHNCQRKTFLDQIRNGVKCVNANNFYKAKFGPEVIGNCRTWWTTEKQEFLATLTKNEKLIPLVAHIHVKYQQITTKKGEGFTKDYSEGGKYLILNPDSNDLMSLCPVCINFYRRIYLILRLLII
ncbi:hypothetical protein FDP41_011167 [Naegleria fowleri]|uniref:Uncharacterized protein n=1 Tax=Naegleria fowleri TaxID=5763 RepID=A0A6A5CD15_NAEFO|nr:uncharacterized protein FDP41_011167 [Naegleria fowleri]KAF0983189.1 hypothetical protein FDP41_011167 [Naegleria fowleri]